MLVSCPCEGINALGPGQITMDMYAQGLEPVDSLNYYPTSEDRSMVPWLFFPEVKNQVLDLANIKTMIGNLALLN